MSEQLTLPILASDIGYHNANLASTHSRLFKDGSWKNQRVHVIVPASDKIATKVALAIWNLQFPPNQGVLRHIAVGTEVGVAYSTLIEQILNTPGLNEWEYVLTVEHDNLPNPGDLLKLVWEMERHPEFAAIGGLYFTKGFGGCAQIWGDVKDPAVNFRPQLPDLNGGLVECCGTGMGFTLYRLAMFKDQRLRKPWFKTADGCTQDLYFWTDAKKYGYRCAVDCSVKVGHYDHEGKFGIPGMVW